MPLGSGTCGRDVGIYIVSSSIISSVVPTIIDPQVGARSVSRISIPFSITNRWSVWSIPSLTSRSVALARAKIFNIGMVVSISCGWSVSQWGRATAWTSDLLVWERCARPDAASFTS